MYIRRKVYSALQDENGEVRYFSTNEFIDTDLEDRYFARAIMTPGEKAANEAGHKLGKKISRMHMINNADENVIKSLKQEAIKMGKKGADINNYVNDQLQKAYNFERRVKNSTNGVKDIVNGTFKNVHKDAVEGAGSFAKGNAYNASMKKRVRSAGDLVKKNWKKGVELVKRHPYAAGGAALGTLGAAGAGAYAYNKYHDDDED